MHLFDIAYLFQGLVQLGLQKVTFGLTLVLLDNMLGLEFAEFVLILILELEHKGPKMSFQAKR